MLFAFMFANFVFTMSAKRTCVSFMLLMLCAVLSSEERIEALIAAKDAFSELIVLHTPAIETIEKPSNSTLNNGIS